MKNIEIGLSCSPAKFISDELLKGVVKVLVTYGGGMGGSNQTHHATKVEGNTYTLVNGRVIELNPEYIVSKETVTLVKIVTDVTGHANYSERTCNSKISTVVYELPFNTIYTLKNSYKQNKLPIIINDTVEK